LAGDVVGDINAGFINYFKNQNWVSMVEWLVFGIIVIGAFFGFYIWYKNKRIFNKIIIVHEIVNGEFIETYKDSGKSVKLGSGGFEIIFLKKLKTWKLGMGARSGRNRYDFWIMPDGYWYSGKIYPNIYTMNETKGMIPIVTTNASMRSQYTSLEKQIDSLHAKKTDFFEKYGGMIMGIIFTLVSGIMLWLMWKEFVTVSANLNNAIVQVGNLMDKINLMMGNVQGQQGAGGLIKT
jgi:hypothetical protein